MEPVRRDPDPTDPPTLEAVVARAFHLPSTDLHAPTRRADIALARQVAIYVAHVGLAETLTAAGRRFGRDRSTAAHACRRVEDRRDDPGFDGLVAGIEAAVAASRSNAGQEVAR
ncbi:helix-turn-helix domain-containing protein [Pseudoxanthobacter sp. M-2]